MIRIIHFQRVHGFDAVDHDRLFRSFSGCSHDFLVIAVTDQDDRPVLPGEFQRFEMDFGDERASGVNDAEGAVLGFLANSWRQVELALRFTF